MANVKKPGGKKASRREAAKRAKQNTAAVGAKAANEPEAEPGQVLRAHDYPDLSKPPKPRPEEVSRETLVKKAYQKVDKKLEQGDPSKAIDDLVKLMKLEKDLGGEQKDVKEIKVRWESSEDKSSSEG